MPVSSEQECLLEQQLEKLDCCCSFDLKSSQEKKTTTQALLLLTIKVTAVLINKTTKTFLLDSVLLFFS